MKRTFLAVILVITASAWALFALTGCTMVGNTPKAQTTVVQSAGVLDDAALDVQTENGAVEVIVDDNADEVTVEATIRCVGETQEEAEQRAAGVTLDIARGTDRTLVIRPVYPDKRRSSDGVSFLIRTPRVRDVSISTSNGLITLTGAAGPLEARTSNGAITVTDHDGPATLETSNGRITATGVRGAVDAHTSNGSITAELADDASGPLRLDTSNGAIEISVSAAFRGTITLDTSNGSIDVQDSAGIADSTNTSKNHAKIMMGEGPDSTAQTSNGSIRITVRE